MSYLKILKTSFRQADPHIINYIKKVGVLIKSPVVHLPSTISPVEEVNTALYFLKSESQPFIETYCVTPRKVYKLARFQGPSPILE